MKKTINIPVVWAIIEKEENWEKYILIQTRWKPWTEYHDTIETPVWRIEDWENIFVSLYREIKEECNLEISHINKQEANVWTNSIWFNPLYCTQQLADWLPRIMFGFVCKCIWELKHQEEETRNPRRIKVSDLPKLMKKKKFFDLEKPLFDYYMDNNESIEYQEFDSKYKVLNNTIVTMRLHSNLFEKIKQWSKTIEMRLFDNKRRAINVWDMISFINRETWEEIVRKVKDLHICQSFEELIQQVWVEAVWRTSNSTIDDVVNRMKIYYSQEDQKKYWVVGIELE